jgi:tetratricopeptide (TPR) repeat protein
MGALHRDPKKLLYTQHLLATLHRAVGDLDRALDYLVRNDDIARIHLLPIQRSFHLTSIAHIQLQQGSIEAALQTYRSAVDLSRRARHAEGLVQALRMLGNALLGLARYDEARPCLEEAADRFAQLEDGASEAEMRAGLAHIDVRSELEAREGLARATRAKGPEDAIPAFESALALAATIGERTREIVIRNTLGILQWQRRDYAAALDHYEVALRLVRDPGHCQQEATILNGLGACLARLGRPDEARTVLEESLALSREIGERELEADAAAALGHVSRSVHHLDGAARYFDQSRAVRHVIGDRRGEGWMHLRLAEVRHETGDTVGALAALARAAQAAADTGDDALATACREAARQGDRQRSGEVKDAPLHHRAVRCGSHT